MLAEASTLLATTLAAERQACVVDARLTFSRCGALAVARLAADLEVWLPHELREILRDTRAFRAHPEGLLPLSRTAAAPEGDAEALRQELERWDRLMKSAEMGAWRMFFLGDRPDESTLPAGTDRGLRARFERLQRALDELATRSEHPPYGASPLAACFRDAAALAAALLPRRSFILTRLEPGRPAPPAICAYLEACGVHTRAVPPRGRRATLPLRDVLARADLGPLSWAGPGFAALHVVMPGFTSLEEDDGAAARGAWLDTDVFWYEV